MATTTPKKLNVKFHQKYHPTLTLQGLGPETSIRDTKDQIFHHTGFVKDKLELEFHGKILDDTKTLGDYHIPDGGHVNFKGFDALSQQMV